jgi:hypothetical protein
MFDHRSGDYTKERNPWLRNDPDEIINEIREMQKQAENVSGSE